MTCTNCTAALPAGAMFCGECGTSVPVTRAPEPERARRPEPEEAPGPNDTAVIMPVEAVPPIPVGLDTAEPVEAPVVPERAQRTDLVAPVAPDDPEDLEDLESTRIVAAGPKGERFILQFSTGESVTVFGTGLIGRNPRPEPEEHFDQIVRVFDATRSVSKTHLEFGQQAGAFWVRDRYSGNGSIVREPEREPFRCGPGKRYLVARGTRIDIGEQFVVVS